jgi:kinesin family protein 18/19
MLYDPHEDIFEGIFRKPRQREKVFHFDYAFDKNNSQKEVYDNTIGFLVDSVLEGYHSSVFAYGATGAGNNGEFIKAKLTPC